MSEPNRSDINSHANETFGETYGRLEKEASESGISRPEAAIYCLAGLLAALVVRLVGRLVHQRVKHT